MKFVELRNESVDFEDSGRPFSIWEHCVRSESILLPRQSAARLTQVAPVETQLSTRTFGEPYAYDSNTKKRGNKCHIFVNSSVGNTKMEWRGIRELSLLQQQLSRVPDKELSYIPL